MQGHDIVVVGASAGGIEPLKVLVGGLPADFPGTVFIVLHLAPHSPGLLPSILAKVTQIPVLTPEDGKPIELRKVYVTPPDHHLLDMPSIAKTLIDVDYSLPANKIPVLLIDLASEPANGIRSPK